MEENEKKKIIVKAKTNTTISEIAKKQIEESKYPVVGAIFNNEYKNLDDELQEDGTLELININSKEGMKIYRRTLTYIMGMAFWKLYPEARVVVNYQLTNAMYCNLENMKVTEEMLYNVQEEMKRIVEKDLKIEKRTMTREEAGKFYEKNNTGKGRLQYDLSTNEKINMSYCEDYFNYFYEIIATHTGVTKIFELKKYYDGFLLRYPSSQDVNVLPEYEETKKLSWALHEYETIYKVLNVGTVYRLNKRVKEGSIKELILLSEALHEKKIAQIADKIAQRKGVKMVLIAGPSSSGKTTLALHIIAEAQKMGGEAAFIDAEHALDPVYARKLGVDIDNLIVSQPDTGEQALEITEALVRSGALDVVVVDSVAALVPKAEIDGEMGDSHMGLQARLMSQALRKLAGAINKSKTVLIFINQLREKIGVMFGNPETTTGGRALKFYASVRMDIRKTEMMKQDGQVIGNRVRVKVIKNKVAPPFREAEFDVLYGKGISKVGNILDMAVNLDIVEKSGAWFSYNGQRISQGRENAKRYLEEHPDIMDEIEKKVRDNFAKAFEQSLGEELPSDDEEDTEPIDEE